LIFFTPQVLNFLLSLPQLLAWFLALDNASQNSTLIQDY